MRLPMSAALKANSITISQSSSILMENKSPVIIIIQTDKVLFCY